MTADTIGVGNFKETLDVHHLSNNTLAQSDNNTSGFASLLSWTKAHNVARLNYEPTGQYNRAFEVVMPPVPRW